MYFIMPTCGTHTKGNEHTLLRVGEKVKQLSWMTDWIFLLTMTCLSKRRMTPGRLFLSRKLLHTLTLGQCQLLQKTSGLHSEITMKENVGQIHLSNQISHHVIGVYLSLSIESPTGTVPQIDA